MDLNVDHHQEDVFYLNHPTYITIMRDADMLEYFNQIKYNFGN